MPASTDRTRADDTGSRTVRAGAPRRVRVRGTRPSTARADRVQVTRVLTWTLAILLAPPAMPGRSYSSQAWMSSWFVILPSRRVTIDSAMTRVPSPYWQDSLNAAWSPCTTHCSSLCVMSRL